MSAKRRNSLRKGSMIQAYRVEAVVSKSYSGITYRVLNTGGARPRLLREYFPAELVSRHKDGVSVAPRPEDEAHYEAGLTDFIRQSRALAQFRSPYIERIEDIIQAHNTAYKVIEFDDGQTLDARIRAIGLPLPVAETERIIKELLRGLGTLHEASIFHLDLTARNVYVRNDGPCMLTGFGNIAADSGFPSTETAQGDLAALAVLIYKCATGSRQRPSLRSVATRLDETGLTDPIKGILTELLDPEKCKQYRGAEEVLRRLPDESPAPKRSRTEIEQSVQNPHAIRPRARQKSRTAASNKPGVSLRLDEVAGVHRKTRIIGGRISGSPRKPRPGGKAGWWILGTVILLVSLAFLLPTPSDDEPRYELADATGPDSPERADIYAESRVDGELEDATLRTDDTTFVRQDDEARANEYRMAELQEARIQELLFSAEAHIEQLEYTEPPGGNALEDYRAVLALNDSNARANEGMVFIMDKLVESGMRMLERDEVTRAGEVSKKIRLIEINSPQATQLERAVATWHSDQQLRRETERNDFIAGVLKNAESAMNQRRILSPIGDNALHYYRELLEFDPGNEQGRQGINSISQHYLGLANDSILTGELGAAEGFLTTVEAIQPENSAITLLRDQINVRKRQEAMGLSQAPPETPVMVEGDIAIVPPDSGNATATALLPDPVAAETAEERPVPKVVDINVEEGPSRTPVLSSDERLLQEGLDAYYQRRYEEAYEYLTPLSYQGIARAQFRIGIMYQLGRGVVRDTTRAEEIIGGALPAIRSFAENGRAWAQADLGSLYEDGIVVMRDYEQAVRWYRAAATQGYAGAQTNLGRMYALGLGVERDKDEAIRWLQMAAAQGDIIASENLKTLGIR